MAAPIKTEDSSRETLLPGVAMLRTARELPAARLESVSPQALDAVLAGIVVQHPRYREAWAAELAWLDDIERFTS